RGQRQPAVQYGGRLGRDTVQQLPVDAGHRARARGAAPVEQGQQLHAGRVPVPRAVHLEVDERYEPRLFGGIPGRLGGRARLGGRLQRAPEAVKILSREVYTAVAVILTDVPEDVRELQGHPERVGQRFGHPHVGRAEDAEGQPPDGPGDAAAVVPQIVEGGVEGAVDVGDAAVDELTEGLHRYGELLAGVVQGDENGVVFGAPRDAGRAGARHAEHLVPGFLQRRQLG